MKRNISSSAGEFLAVPLPHGGFGYARSLDPMMAFYKLRSDTKLDIAIVKDAPIAFIASVHIAWRKRWLRIGHLPLEAKLQKPVDFVKRDVLTGALSIRTRFPGNRNRSDERSALPAECQKLDPAGAWDAEQVEHWLELILDGKEYALLENVRAMYLVVH